MEAPAAVEVRTAVVVAVAEVAHSVAAVAVAEELLPVVEAADDADKKKRWSNDHLFLMCCQHVCRIEQLV